MADTNAELAAKLRKADGEWERRMIGGTAWPQIIAALEATGSQAEAWDEGRRGDHTPACRWSDDQDCTCINPYLDEDDE